MSETDRLLHWLESERDRQLDFLRAFTRIDTCNPPGDTTQAADLFRQFLDAEGIAYFGVSGALDEDPGARSDFPDAKPMALRQAGAEGCYLYSRDPVDAADSVAYARFFNPTVGIAEDPATGTAAGPLAARLVAEGWIPDESTVIIAQGYALGRPSRIAVWVSRQRVRVGGSGLVVAEGALIG